MTGWLALVPACAALLLGGCAARLHSPAELAGVAARCRVDPGELVQERDLKKILFLYAKTPSDQQLDCIHRWARRHHLHFAYLAGVERIEP